MKIKLHVEKKNVHEKICMLFAVNLSKNFVILCNDDYDRSKKQSK